MTVYPVRSTIVAAERWKCIKHSLVQIEWQLRLLQVEGNITEINP